MKYHIVFESRWVRCPVCREPVRVYEKTGSTYFEPEPGRRMLISDGKIISQKIAKHIHYRSSMGAKVVTETLCEGSGTIPNPKLVVTLSLKSWDW